MTVENFEAVPVKEVLMNLRLSTRIDGVVAVVTAAGEVDLETARELRKTLVELIAGGHCHFVLDLEGVTFLDSSGLGVLVGALKRVRSLDGSMKLAALQPSVRKVFEITKLTQVFPIYDSADAALADRPGDAITSMIFEGGC